MSGTKSSKSSQTSKSRDVSAKSSKSSTPPKSSHKDKSAGRKSPSSSSATPMLGPSKHHKHCGSKGTTDPADEPVDEQKNPDTTMTVYNSVKQNGHDRDKAVLAIVKSEQKQRLKDMVKSDKKLGPNVIVTTPRKLQKTIDSITTENTPLYLLVSSMIGTITYHVSKNISRLHVHSCGALYSNALRIGNQSTYCGFSTLFWDSRPEDIRTYEIEYNQGCHYDPSDALTDPRAFSPELKTIPGGIGSDVDEAIVRGFADLQEEINNSKRQGGNGKPQVSPGRGNFANPQTDNEGASWWTRWKHLVALTVGGAAGGGVAGGAMWCTAGGVFFKGPFGLELAAGYFSMGVAGGAAAAGVATGVAAAAVVYLIPWEKVFGFMKGVLWSIWEKICKAVSWVWTKLKEWGAALASAITG